MCSLLCVVAFGNHGNQFTRKSFFRCPLELEFAVGPQHVQFIVLTVETDVTATHVVRRDEIDGFLTQFGSGINVEIACFSRETYGKWRVWSTRSGRENIGRTLEIERQYRVVLFELVRRRHTRAVISDRGRGNKDIRLRKRTGDRM